MKQTLPNHVAIVMDGNGRWAEKQNLPRVEGHRAGIESVRTIVQSCVQKGISILSLFAFSSENWLRPVMEVEYLMKLFITSLQQEITALHENGVQLRFTGDKALLAPELLQCMEAAQIHTANNQHLILNIVLNYSGKWDILQATKRIAQEVSAEHIKIEDIDEILFDNMLATNTLVPPDLFIRTSGEQRISNFFLWQLAYTELYFSPVLWPEFDEKAFDEALESYAMRERRFGRTSRQLSESSYV